MVTTTPGMKLAGVGRHMFAILNQLTLTDLGHQYVVFLRDDVEMPEAWTRCNWITWRRIAIRSSKDRLWWEHFKIGIEAKKLKADLMLSLFLALPIFCRIPMVAFAHDAFPRTHPEWYPPRKRMILDQLTAFACKKSRALVTVSEYSKIELSRAYKIPVSKIFVALNGIGNEIKVLTDEELSCVDMSKFNAVSYIFSVGTIEPRKNLEGLIKGFEQAKKDPRLADVQLLIAGAKGWLDTSVGQAWEESPNKGDIQFLGYVSDVELNALMQRAKMFAITSFVEGFGIPPLEAMTVGTPVLSSNTSALPEVCGEFAFYCDPANFRFISDAMVEGLTNEDRRRTYVDGGKARVQDFSWYESVKSLEIALQFAVN